MEDEVRNLKAPRKATSPCAALFLTVHPSPVLDICCCIPPTFLYPRHNASRQPSSRAKRSSGGSSNTPTRRRSRTARFQLRKHQELDHVRVEKAWSFGQPPQQADAPVKVGEAAYIAATIQNKRYHGILVESQALQAASLLHSQDQAQGLELNRRMQALQPHSSSEILPPSNDIQVDPSSDETIVEATPSSDTTDPSSRKRPRNDESKEAEDRTTATTTTTEQAAPPDRPIQKFVYEAATKLRRLVATFGNVAVAADGTDGALPTSIREACQNGGGFVGRYYYQYEVRCKERLGWPFVSVDSSSLHVCLAACSFTHSLLAYILCTHRCSHEH